MTLETEEPKDSCSENETTQNEYSNDDIEPKRSATETDDPPTDG